VFSFNPHDSSEPNRELNRELHRVGLVMECTRRPVQLSEADAAELFAGTAKEFWRWVVHHETGMDADHHPSPTDPHWLRVRHELASLRGVPVESIEPTSRLGI